MYDRRVVRGNTFAALVIPVSKILVRMNIFRYAARPSPDREIEAGIHVQTIKTRAA